MNEYFSTTEVQQILSEVRGGASLEELHCPRDRAVLKVFFSKFRTPNRSGHPKGVLHGVWGDVTEITLECHTCGAWRARISLRGTSP